MNNNDFIMGFACAKAFTDKEKYRQDIINNYTTLKYIIDNNRITNVSNPELENAFISAEMEYNKVSKEIAEEEKEKHDSNIAIAIICCSIVIGAIIGCILNFL